MRLWAFTIALYVTAVVAGISDEVFLSTFAAFWAGTIVPNTTLGEFIDYWKNER